jgi:hypothetical protein
MILPVGLSNKLSDFYIGVCSMGSGKAITPIPIFSGGIGYLPSFDPYASAEPVISETPPVLDPVVPEIPVEPVLPNEPVLPPVLELPPRPEPSDPRSEVSPQWPVWGGDPPVTITDIFETPTIIVEDRVPAIDPQSIPEFINQPIYTSIDWGWNRLEYLTLGLAEYQNLAQVAPGASITPYSDLVHMNLDFVVESANHDLDSIQMAIMKLQNAASPLSIQLTSASTPAGSADQHQVAVPEPAAGLALLSGAVGLGAFVRRGGRLDQQAR